MLASDMAPTRSAVLQLREEHEVILEAYDFLDEKRLLLAAELLRQLKQYEDNIRQYEALREKAEHALVASVKRHGLQGAQVYPGHYLENAVLRSENTLFMGVSLTTTGLNISEEILKQSTCHPSPEAEACRELFQRLVRLAAVVAGLSGNLHRLLEEYRRTERRARALENVVIPEMSHTLREMSTQLEELDQEDIVRVHLKHK
jgi:V/A-type H+-transporting ATPase subunit D